MSEEISDVVCPRAELLSDHSDAVDPTNGRWSGNGHSPSKKTAVINELDSDLKTSLLDAGRINFTTV